MSVAEKLIHELKAVTVAALYFGCWIGGLLLIKSLVLAEYDIAFAGWTMAIVGALVLSKVVLILEHVPLGSRSKARPAWTDVLLRTALYLAGVVVVLLLERGFEGRHEHGGFLAAILVTFEGSKGVHVWLNSICIGGALLGYNLASVLRRNLGEGAFWQMLSRPLPLVTISLLSLSTSWLDSA
jgi:hypothetical protein